MPELYPSQERASLLADVAEMYYMEEKDQAEIAQEHAPLEEPRMGLQHGVPLPPKAASRPDT